MKNSLLLLIFTFILFGCKDSTVGYEESASVNEPRAMSETIAAPTSADEASPITEDATIETKIIKNGNLKFECSDLDKTYSEISANIKKHNGYIQNDSQGTEYNNIYRNIVVRIPSANFDSFLGELSKGVSYFDLKEINLDDVTQEYIDLDARLKTKKELENRYYDLLKKASKVSEIIEIEKQLSEIREEIESKEGQLKYMKSQVSKSTITIYFYKLVAEKSGASVSFFSKTGTAFVSGFNSISSFFVGLVYIWPFLLILVLAFYFIRRKIRNKSKQ